MRFETEQTADRERVAHAPDAIAITQFRLDHQRLNAHRGSLSPLLETHLETT
jgi:hypothetical protein